MKEDSPMSGCCGHDTKFDGVSDDYKRRLWIVIALNATMFAVEMTAGHLAPTLSTLRVMQ